MNALKELIIKCLQDSGYDTFTACEIAYDFMPEIKAMPKGKHTIQAGDFTITFNKGN